MTYDWVNDYIGIPFKTNGRDRDGMDCYGLIAAVYKDLLDIDVPDWAVKNDHIFTVMQTITKGLKIEVTEERAYEVANPNDMDILVLSRISVAYHVGIYVAGGVLHTVYNGNGSCYESLESFMAKCRGDIRWYRWQI